MFSKRGMYIILWRCSSAIFPRANPSPVSCTSLTTLAEEVPRTYMYIIRARPPIRRSSPPTVYAPVPCSSYLYPFRHQPALYYLRYTISNNNIFNIPPKTFRRYLEVSIINRCLTQSSSFLINHVINYNPVYGAGCTASRLPPLPHATTTTTTATRKRTYTSLSIHETIRMYACAYKDRRRVSAEDCMSITQVKFHHLFRRGRYKLDFRFP